MTLWREHGSGIGEAWVPGLIPNHVTLIQSMVSLRLSFLI